MPRGRAARGQSFTTPSAPHARLPDVPRPARRFPRGCEGGLSHVSSDGSVRAIADQVSQRTAVAASMAGGGGARSGLREHARRGRGKRLSLLRAVSQRGLLRPLSRRSRAAAAGPSERLPFHARAGCEAERAGVQFVPSSRIILQELPHARRGHAHRTRVEPCEPGTGASTPRGLRVRPRDGTTPRHRGPTQPGGVRGVSRRA